MNFSEYLSHYIKIHDISVSELAEKTEIDRTVLYRYIKGERKPSKKETVVSIIRELQMSVDEEKELLEEYEKLIYGETAVCSYRYVRNLLKELRHTDNSLTTAASVKTYWKQEGYAEIEESIVILHSKQEIISNILNLIEHTIKINEEKECSKPQICLRMQPDYMEIQNLLLPIFQQKNISIEQLICLEQNSNECYQNLHILQSILPLCFGLKGYKVFYYYASLSSQYNSMVLMPNLLLWQDCAVIFDYDMQQGVCIRHSDYVKMLQKQYRKMRDGCRPLLLNGEGIENVYGFHQNILDLSGRVLFGQPCVGLCLSRDLLEKHIYPMPGKEEFINGLIETHGDWQNETYIKLEGMEYHTIAYSTKEGLETFLESGWVAEFPKGLYEPFDKEERLCILNRMIKQMESGNMAYYFLEEGNELPLSIQFYLNEDKKELVINYIQENNMTQVVIGEISIYRTFLGYLEYMEKKGMVCGKEESLKYLRERWRRGRRKGK